MYKSVNSRQLRQAPFATRFYVNEGTSYYTGNRSIYTAPGDITGINDFTRIHGENDPWLQGKSPLFTLFFSPTKSMHSHVLWHRKWIKVNEFANFPKSFSVLFIPKPKDPRIPANVACTNHVCILM